MLSIDKNSFKRDYENKFVQLHGKELKEGTNQQKYEALGSLVKDYVTNMWIETNKEYKEEELKQVYYGVSLRKIIRGLFIKFRNT